MGRNKCVAAGLVLCMAGLCLVPARAEARQNVVFVLIDALRADRIDATRNGVALTPYLSSLPAVRFNNAVSPASWTLPAMAALLTSQYVDTNGVFAMGGSLPPNIQSMAAYFKEAGYRTIGIQTNGNLSAEKGFDQGFDQYDVIAPDQCIAQTVTARSLAATQSLGQPFFLYAHYLDPHMPYTPPQIYRSPLGYPNPTLSIVERSIVEDFLPYFWDHLSYVMGKQPAPTFPVLSNVGKESVETLYDGETRYADDQVRVLVDDILARYPDTIVVILADHGDHFWEHNQLGHLTTLYEPLVRVPLFIKAPGLAPATINDLVDTVGVLPTLAGMLGLPAKPAWQGVDLFAPRNPQGPVFSCAKSGSEYNLDLEMARLDSVKVICNRRAGTVELYDLATDPDELVNLAQLRPVQLKQMMRLLNLHLLQNARQNGADDTLWAEPAGSYQEKMRLHLVAPEGFSHVWFKDGQPIDEDPPRLTGTGTQSLFIASLGAADSGGYECMYSDDTQNLRITSPYAVDVLPEGTLPLFGVGMAVSMMVSFAGLGCLLLRRRGGGPLNIQ